MNELELLNALKQSWEDYKKVNDERLAALEKNEGVSEITNKLDKINADIDKYQNALNDLQASVNRINVGNAGPGESEAKKEFANWLRNGQDKEFKMAAQVDTQFDPSGGYFIIPEIDAIIDRIAAENSPMRQLARVIPTTNNSVKRLLSVGGASGAWVAETGVRVETVAPELKSVEIFAHELYANPPATQAVLDDAAVDPVAWLGEEVGITFGELEGAAFISGTGSGQPSGILKDVVANSGWTAANDWNKAGYIPTGGNTLGSSDNLLTLVYALKSKYRNNGAWLMNNLTMAAIRKLKVTGVGKFDKSGTLDGDMGWEGGYLWQPSFQAGQPSTLLGYPVYEDDNMDDIGSGKFPVAFGDFKQGYNIVDRKGISVLRDPYTKKGFVLFYTTRRTGGSIYNGEAIKILKTASS